MEGKQRLLLQSYSCPFVVINGCFVAKALLELMSKGIPVNKRAQVWKAFLQPDKLKSRYPEGYYQDLEALAEYTSSFIHIHELKVILPNQGGSVGQENTQKRWSWCRHISDPKGPQSDTSSRRYVQNRRGKSVIEMNHQMLRCPFVLGH